MALAQPPIREPNQNSYVWMGWFQQLHDYITDVGNLSWTVIDFTGSDLTDIATRNHNDLQSQQGGSLTERYHLTSTQITKIGNQRVVVMTDATSCTPTGDTADMNTQVNTQAIGILTVNAPTGSPSNDQKLILRFTCTNVQTFSWNAIYRGSSDLSLPTSTTGGVKTDYYGFIYNSTAVMWDIVAKNAGF